MPRKRQRRRGQQARSQTTGARSSSPERIGASDWRWRTFPVFFAFVMGVLVSYIVIATSGTLALAVFYAALFGVGYGLAHMFVRNVIVAGRLRRQRQAARGEREEETEEELVYPDEQSR